ncbi:MAG: porin family protein [Opitutae bacterium]
MISPNVNNLISHPPHPRRAVPANLPPGAFFSQFTGVYLKGIFFLFFSFAIPIGVLGNPDIDLSQRIAELRLKSNAHEKFVNELLAKEVTLPPISLPDSHRMTDDPFVQPDEPLSLPSVALPPVVGDNFLSEQNTGAESPSQNMGTSVLSSHQGEEIAFEEEEVSATPTSPEKEYPLPDQKKPSYEELYAPKVPPRRMGYYFGPFIGPVFPDDSAVRNPNISYDSKSGVTGGLRIGKDFGSARIEGEYSFLSHKIHADSESGKVNFHNLHTRLILEKNLGERADIRAGIGLGIGFINKELGANDYSGAGFTYDFLLGWSFRVMNNWSVNMDYRHYLTAAHKNYDRLQGHVIELSAGFDL